MDKNYKEKHHEYMINFKYFEQMMRKILKKVGYKQALRKRERDEEIKIDFVMKKEAIGTNVSHDLFNFIELFSQYNDSLDETSELELVFFPYFSLILKNLKENISKGAIGNETDEALLLYFKNLLTYIGRPSSYLLFFKIFIFILNCFNPEHYLYKKLYIVSQGVSENEINYDDNDQILYKKIQLSMNESGVTEYIINIICNYKDFVETNVETDKSLSLEEFMNKDKITYAYLDEAINLLIRLLNNHNTKIQDFILKFLKRKRTVGFFHYIQERLITGYVQKDSVKPQENSNSTALMIGNNAHEISQDQKIKSKEMYNPNNILELIQLLCSNSNVEFQDYMYEQISSDKMIKQISVNILAEVVNLLDRITSLKVDVFKDYLGSMLTKNVLKTLIKMVSGPSFKNQEYLGKWRKLYKILNFYITQDLDNMSPITEERVNKIDTFCLSVELIKSLLKTKKQNKKMIAKSIIEEISISELIKKMIDINNVYHVQTQTYLWGGRGNTRRR